MSIIDSFISKVIDFNEKEKEETILFLAESLINDNYEFLKLISPKVQSIVLPFLTDIAVKSLGKTVGSLKIMKGGKEEKMEEWYGIMDWPLDVNWKCEICGEVNLLWGIPHALCRCETCHTQYRMRDKEGKIVKVPICQLKTEYYEPAKKLYRELKIPMTQWTDKQWDITIKSIKLKGGEKVVGTRLKDNQRRRT